MLINQKVMLDLGPNYISLWGVKLPQFIYEVQKSPRLRDSGLTPLQLAQKLGYREIVDILQNPDQAKLEKNIPIKEPDIIKVPLYEPVIQKRPIHTGEESLKKPLHQLRHALKALENSLPIIG